VWLAALSLRSLSRPTGGAALVDPDAL